MSPLPGAAASSSPEPAGTAAGAVCAARREREERFCRAEPLLSAPPGSPAPTKVTGASAPLRAASSAPARAGACCPGARRPWPWPGCLRAAEPCALATAVTPSFAERQRPAKPRTTRDCPTGQTTQTTSPAHVSGQRNYRVHPAARTVRDLWHEPLDAAARPRPSPVIHLRRSSRVARTVRGPRDAARSPRDTSPAVMPYPFSPRSWRWPDRQPVPGRPALARAAQARSRHHLVHNQ